PAGTASEARPRRDTPRVRNLERRIFFSVVAAGLPAVLAAGYFLWTQPLAPELRWAGIGFLLTVWIGYAESARRTARDQLHVVANLLAALREGDYSVRGLLTAADTSVAIVMREIN